MVEVEAMLQKFEKILKVEEVETWESQVVWVWRGGEREEEERERKEERE